jgi:hypothetical protein
MVLSNEILCCTFLILILKIVINGLPLLRPVPCENVRIIHLPDPPNIQVSEGEWIKPALMELFLGVLCRVLRVGVDHIQLHLMVLIPRIMKGYPSTDGSKLHSLFGSITKSSR